MYIWILVKFNHFKHVIQDCGRSGIPWLPLFEGASYRGQGRRHAMASLLGSPNLTKLNWLNLSNDQVVLAAFTVLELGLDVVMSWAPGYLLAKMAFLAWCMAPIHENGSNVIFNQVRLQTKWHVKTIQNQRILITAKIWEQISWDDCLIIFWQGCTSPVPQAWGKDWHSGLISTGEVTNI